MLLVKFNSTDFTSPDSISNVRFLGNFDFPEINEPIYSSAIQCIVENPGMEGLFRGRENDNFTAIFLHVDDMSFINVPGKRRDNSYSYTIHQETRMRKNQHNATTRQKKKRQKKSTNAPTGKN